MRRMVRWTCPTEGSEHSAVLAPTKPRGDDVRRFCLECSSETGRLVRRVSPVLAAKREHRVKVRKAKAEGRAIARKARRDSYYEVAGVQLHELMMRYLAADAWIGTPLRTRNPRPELRIRRTQRKPRRYGTAWASQHRIQIVDFPGVDEHSVKETLIHELAHLAAPGDHHGTKWRTLFRLACEELLGVRPKVERRYHGEVSSRLREMGGGVPASIAMRRTTDPLDVRDMAEKYETPC